LYDDLILANTSRDYFRQAAATHTNVQIPLVNLALLELSAFRDPGAALTAVEEALRRTEWDRPGSTPKTIVAVPPRLRSCGEAGNTTDPENRSQIYNESMVQVEQVAATAGGWIKAAFVGGAPPDKTWPNRVLRRAFTGG